MKVRSTYKVANLQHNLNILYNATNLLFLSFKYLSQAVSLVRTPANDIRLNRSTSPIVLVRWKQLQISFPSDVHSTILSTELWIQWIHKHEESSNQTPNVIVSQKWFPIAKTCYSETTNKARSLLLEALKGVPDIWSKKRSLAQTLIKKRKK